MSYPTLEQYSEAFQHPQSSLIDPLLKKGRIATTGLGLPLALCGGFALTYTVDITGRKYAVRCFHKQSNGLEKRYSAISNRLKNLHSQYFLDFEFQPNGIRVNGNTYPIVKMAWASGVTLGEFLDTNYKKKNELQHLNSALHSLATYLEMQQMAHGDIQPGNVMVANAGRSIQLIDYDGMFVNDLKGLGSSELGHRNFQHPKRVATSWDSSLDRFSFIALNIAIRVLEVYPDLWSKTQSDGDTLLFKANDFADPTGSTIFQDLFNRPQFAEDAKNFAAICKAPFEKIPKLEDFLARRNIPQVALTVTTTNKTVPAKYISAYPVLDASNYARCLSYVGDRVELIGRIVEVRSDKTRYGKPYTFINFGNWRGNMVRITIWSEGLAVISQRPDESWVGQWISVVGLMEPPYVNKKYKYSHLAISITQSNQLHKITEREAKLRLSGEFPQTPSTTPHSRNKEISLQLRGSGSATTRTTAPNRAPTTQNQAILQGMKGRQQTHHQQPLKNNAYSSGNKTASSSSSCFIATAVYGQDAVETNALRAWRDRVLMPSTMGRCFVKLYYVVAPQLLPFIQRSSIINSIVRTALNKFIASLNLLKK